MFVGFHKGRNGQTFLKSRIHVSYLVTFINGSSTGYWSAIWYASETSHWTAKITCNAKAAFSGGIAVLITVKVLSCVAADCFVAVTFKNLYKGSWQNSVQASWSSWMFEVEPRADRNFRIKWTENKKASLWKRSHSELRHLWTLCFYCADVMGDKACVLVKSYEQIWMLNFIL